MQEVFSSAAPFNHQRAPSLSFLPQLSSPPSCLLFSFQPLFSLLGSSPPPPPASLAPFTSSSSSNHTLPSIPSPSSLPLPVGRASYHVGDMSVLLRHTVYCRRAAAWRLVERGAEQLKGGVAAVMCCSNRGAGRADRIRRESRRWVVLDCGFLFFFLFYLLLLLASAQKSGFAFGDTEQLMSVAMILLPIGLDADSRM